MDVPLLDLNAQHAPLRDELAQALLRVLDSGRFIGGPEVEGLEAEVAAYTGAAHAAGVSSGTDALLACLMALEIRPGDLVLTTPYSFFATAGVIARLGARPEFIDIEPETLTMDPEALEAWLERHVYERYKVKAVMPVHLYGQCAHMDALMRVACRFKAPVIEDAAQTLGATYPSRSGETLHAGAIGLAGCFSFFPTKNLGGLGDGGMVVTNDAAFAERVRRMRNHGAESRYRHIEVGGNFRLDALQAAALRVKLPHLDAWNAQRRENAAYYDEHLDDGIVQKPPIAHGREHHIYHQYVVRVPERRDELREHLRNRGIAHEVYYPVPFHLQPCFEYLGYTSGDFPNSEDAAARSLALPVYPGLTRAMQDHVIESLHTFYRA